MSETVEESTAPPAQDEARETIYINNLNDKVSIPKLKSSLQSLFKKYGTIIQITAHKNIRMKGQAFITFDSIDSSKAAVNELQNFELFNRPIRIKYAHSNSDTYYSTVVPDHDVITKRKTTKEQSQSQREALFKQRIDLVANKSSIKKLAKSFKSLPPHKILILQKIDNDSITNDDISEFFNKFAGFINSRYVKVRNLSFVEFETTTDSSACLDILTKPQPKDSDSGSSRGSDLSATFGANALLTFAKR